jgi:arylsulfatase A-like enzyme
MTKGGGSSDSRGHETNVLLVVLDSVRAKNTTLHGYSRSTTPFLETFAERATVYSQARSPGTDSITSHISMFTNEHVEEHGATENTTSINNDRTIWRYLARKKGYATGLFTPNAVIANASNLHEAFETTKSARFSPLNNRDSRLYKNAYDPSANLVPSKFTHLRRCAAHDRPIRSFLNCSSKFVFPRIKRVAETLWEDEYRKLPGDTYISAFLDWMRSVERPWAACLNLLDAHVPYAPRDEFDLWSDGAYKKRTGEIIRNENWELLRETIDYYDACIRQLDDFLNTLVDRLETRGSLDDTLLVVTSDHGLGFGESSHLYPEVKMMRKKWGLHEVLTHVPLVVKYPGQDTPAVRDEVASLTNFPTVVRRVLNDDDGDPFVDEGYALASTARLFENEVYHYRNVDFVEKCVGPWKAVYENDSGDVVKYMIRDGEGVVVRIPDAQSATIVEGDATSKVWEYYDAMTSSGTQTGTSEISEELSAHLRDLGYHK